MSSVIYKPTIIIEELGELGVLPDGGIINAGGVKGPNFSIGGKAVILADGTASDGSGQVIIVEGSTGPGISGVTGYEHNQVEPVKAWIISHNKNTQKAQVTVWDSGNEMMYPDVVKIIDLNTVLILFNTPISGRAILMLF